LVALATSLYALDEELNILIEQTAPPTKIAARYNHITTNQRGDDGAEQTSLPRQFWVRWDSQRRETFGSSQSLYRIDAAVVIGYPKSDNWSIDRMADMDCLSKAVDAYTPTATGVQFIEALDGAEQVVTESASGDYVWAELPIFAEIFVT